MLTSFSKIFNPIKHYGFSNYTPAYKFSQIDQFNLYFKDIDDQDKLAQATSLFNPEKQPQKIDYLANQNHMHYNVAEAWLHLYYHFMSVQAFNQIQGIPLIKYTPHCVRQVHRLHTLNEDDYKKFCKYLTKSSGNSHNSIIPLSTEKKTNITDAISDLQQQSEAFSFDSSTISRLLYQNNELEPQIRFVSTGLDAWRSYNQNIILDEACFYIRDRRQAEKVTKAMAKVVCNIRKKKKTSELESILMIQSHFRKEFGLQGDQKSFFKLFWSSKEPDQSIPWLRVSDFKDKEKVDEEALDSINSITFPTFFLDQLACEQLIKSSEAIEWVKEYKKFLYLLMKNPDNAKGIVCPENVDQVWHLHIQNTEHYKTVKGIIPSVKHKSEAVKKKDSFFGKFLSLSTNHYSNTCKTYEKIFSQRNKIVWPNASSNDHVSNGVWRCILAGRLSAEINPQQSDGYAAGCEGHYGDDHDEPQLTPIDQANEKISEPMTDSQFENFEKEYFGEQSQFSEGDTEVEAESNSWFFSSSSDSSWGSSSSYDDYSGGDGGDSD